MAFWICRSPVFGWLNNDTRLRRRHKLGGKFEDSMGHGMGCMGGAEGYGGGFCDLLFTRSGRLTCGGILNGRVGSKDFITNFLGTECHDIRGERAVCCALCAKGHKRL
jgi:hypothetical protein